MDFDLNSFTIKLKSTLADNMPYEADIINQSKHPNNLEHIRDVALRDNEIIPIGTNGYSFDLGNDNAEMNYPYYHILEDAKIIHKRGKSTAKSRGSQSYVSIAKRDYGIVQQRNGKSYQEYRGKNYRGGREPKSTSNTYLNKHYNYIEKILDMRLDLIAKEFNLKRLRNGSQDLYELNELYSQDLLNNQD